ncbi:hypothetical protein CEP53_015378, partial [Fusarium sp. AF-6]
MDSGSVRANRQPHGVPAAHSAWSICGFSFPLGDAAAKKNNRKRWAALYVARAL